MKLLPAIFLLVVSSLAVAGQPPVASPEVSTPTEAALFAKGAINAMKALPIDGFNMVEAGGETYFISRNGRFAFKGQLMDTWSKTPITRIEQVDSVMNRIPLADMKLNIDELGPVLVGKGKTSVVVFVDPQCRYCKSCSSSYRHSPIVTPSRLSRSRYWDRSRRFWSTKSNACSKPRTRKRRRPHYSIRTTLGCRNSFQATATRSPCRKW